MSAPHLETPAIEGNPHSLSCIPTEPARDVFASQPLIVRFREVGKSFRRFDYQPFLLRNVLLRLTGRAHKPREFWPLRNVSFDIRRGETVGVVGQNGSGKSTLLRLIAGACYPSEGAVSVRGRIAPLLALGAGFHPDMTGRECVEVNGTALGLTRSEIRDRMDQILDFAELVDFLDTPVRYYSSGMLARLGFSVAVHTDPDLLLVDEVLSVGDHAFQHKCLQRIQDIRASGTTILFVSHDADTVERLCDRVLWLREGRLLRDGDPKRVLAEYLATDG
ncbi:MAG: ABC transporter ATP-binding protein [Myxococcales bacterium]|jgi:ABC-type polysaccharide/polyol phosphate transport system ATPase subunit|nr:ABC transporter ATP-binding protein [Myxococcales bacterium]